MGPDRGGGEPRGGGGRRLQYEMPGCLCWGSEKIPIMKDALGKKKKNRVNLEERL